MHIPDFQWFVPILRGAFFGLLAMALHECGHMAAAQATGLRVKRVGLSWKGMYTVREAGPAGSNAVVSLCGPLANLVLMVFWPVSPVFGLANFFCGVCNLLPIPGSDGRRVLKCLSEMRATNLRNRELRAGSETRPAPVCEPVLDGREKAVDPSAQQSGIAA